MKTAIFADTLGALDVFSIVIDVALVMALIPSIQGFIKTAQVNMTTGETAISGLIVLVLVLALMYSVGKQTGVLNKG